MSNWTHVAGIIRIDSMRIFDENIDFDKKIGKECLWDDDIEVWDEMEKHPKRFMPMGSEGSLRKVVWDNPNKDSVAAYTVSIFGDLRDHDDPDEIINWFKKVCEKFIVRNAAITVYNELNGNRFWNYTYGD